MSCCIQFLKWNALSLHFYSKNSFSKNIHYVMHLIFKNGINNIFPSQTSFLLLTHASFANKPIKFCLCKPNTNFCRHSLCFAVIIFIQDDIFLLSVFFSKFRGLHLCQMKQNRKSGIMTKKVIDRGKRSRTLSEAKPVKNTSKNPQSFLQINPEQKEVHL